MRSSVNRLYKLTVILTVILSCLVFLAWIYPSEPSLHQGTITHLSFTPDSSQLLVCQGELNLHAEDCEILVFDCKTWKVAARMGKGLLKSAAWTAGHLRKRSGFITITRKPAEHRDGVPFYYWLFPAFVARAHAAPPPDGPHEIIEWDYQGKVLKRIEIQSRDIPGLGVYDEVTDLAIDPEDNIVVAGTTITFVVQYGLQRLIGSSKGWTLHLPTLKPAWELGKGYPQVKPSSDNLLCVCCRTSTPLPYATSGKPDTQPELKLLDIRSGKLLAQLDTQKYQPLLVNWWGATNKLLLLDMSKRLLLLTNDLTCEKHLVDTGLSEAPALELTTDAQGRLVVLASQKEIEVYSADTWKLQHRWHVAEPEKVTSVACSADGQYIAWAVARRSRLFLRGTRTFSRLRVFDIKANRIVLDTQ